MERARVTELHYMAPIETLESICRRGLLCHMLAEAVPHRSIADEEIQDRRVGKRVPGGLLLHEYVNLYFDARNAMMVRQRGEYPNVIVVRVSPAVLDLPGTVLTDGNAASDYSRFLASPAGLAELDEEYVYRRDWRDANVYQYWEKKRRRQAEVLVPGRVPPEYVVGCYTYDDERSALCLRVREGLVTEVNRDVFL